MTVPSVGTQQVNISEDEALILAARIRPVSPFTPYGVTEVQAHVSPMENMRVAGVPRLDVQFELSDNDEGVMEEDNP